MRKMYSILSFKKSLGKSVLPIMIILTAVSGALAAGKTVDTTLSDKEFFEALDLTRDGLSKVRKAVNSGNLDAAAEELADYYRQRPLAGHWWKKSYQPIDKKRGNNCYENTFKSFYNKQNPYGNITREENGSFNWLKSSTRDHRMYFFSSLADAWRYSKDEKVIEVFEKLYKSWIEQFPASAKKNPGWPTMVVGIRLRTGWGDAFASMSKSPEWDSESMLLFLKSFYEQAAYLRHNHSETSNWLTFELAGLYSAGVLFPEFKDSADWRQHAVETALHDIEQGWLPDGVSVELSLGYGQFFTNFLTICDLADETGRNNRSTQKLANNCESLFTPYLQLAAPDGTTPAINDNRPVNVSKFLSEAAERFPHRKDFLWAVTNGNRGAKPDYLSVGLPYSGLLAIRSGWQRDDNFLCFVAGDVGYRHAHQDKLSVTLWAHGREVIYDPGAKAYSGGKRNQLYQQYIYDTFSHSTALVDNRPQRRKWYRKPHPDNMPYEEVEDFDYQITDQRVWARGVYEDHYGKAGSIGNDAYPYKDGGNFKQDWCKPAVHERQIFYIAPDIFLVQDIFTANDDNSHKYDVRWQVDSVKTQLEDFTLQTKDPEIPNVAVAGLWTDGLDVEAVSAQDSPEVMGWKVIDADNPEPATTLRHIKTGKGRQQFLTLLLPLKTGSDYPGAEIEKISEKLFALNLGDGRVIRIMPAGKESNRLRAISINR